MMQVSVKTVGNATSSFLAISFVLCTGLSLIFAKHQMTPMLQMWLPGYVGLTEPSFLLGLVESYAYGWFIAVLWVPLYRFFAQRFENERGHKEVVSLRKEAVNIPLP